MTGLSITLGGVDERLWTSNGLAFVAWWLVIDGDEIERSLYQSF